MRVLLVESDLTLARGLGSMIKGLGAVVDHCDTGAEALELAAGLLVTSATLRDAGLGAEPEEAWAAAEARVGATHLPTPAIRAAVPSPPGVCVAL